MEPVGGIASILTLIKAASILVSSTRELASKFKRAPQELHTITSQLLAIKSELELVQGTADHARNTLLTDDLCAEVDAAIRQARDAVASIDLISAAAKGNRTFGARYQWISKSQKKVDDLLESLRLARDRLMFLLQILSW